MSWLKYAGKRLLMLIPVIICVTFVLFLILSAAPGDLARSLLGDDATPEQIAEKKAEMGLDQPLLVRYVRYMGGVLRLDFGESWINGEAVLARFARRLPNTLLLSTLAMLFAVAVGMPLGIGSAIKQYSLLDYGSSFVAMLLFSLPAFWLGTMCQVLFCLTLHWLPTSGFDSPKSLILAYADSGCQHHGYHDPHEPHQYAGRYPAGLHPYRQGQGRTQQDGHPSSCPAQRHDPRRDPDRRELCRHHRRRCGYGKHFHHSRRRHHAFKCREIPGRSRGAGNDHLRDGDRWRDQSSGRPAVRGD